jgi:hypothetical protein
MDDRAILSHRNVCKDGFGLENVADAGTLISSSGLD